MMKSEDKLITEIEGHLHAYEEAYQPGAWEAFQQKRKRRGVAMWFLRAGAAAAILLLLGYGAFYFSNKPVANTQFVQNKNNVPLPVTKQIVSAPKNILPDTARPIAGVAAKNNYRDTARPAQYFVKHDTARPIPNAAKYLAITKPSASAKDSSFAMATNAVKVNKDPVAGRDTARPGKSAVNNLQSNVIANNQPEKIKQDDKPMYDLLTKGKTNERASTSLKDKVKSLSYAVSVSPALGNQKVNFGTGVQVFYNISKNFALSSGIAYSSLNGASTGESVGDPFKRVQGADLALTGVEVPLTFQYRTNNGFYLSAGVTGMNVINDHLNYNYVPLNNLSASLSNANSNMLSPVLTQSAERKTEESKEKISNYMGFYILSVGKKKAVGKNQINFGPFLRVPFGAVSSQKVNLTQGGVHLGFEF